jgi:hypothetical protein
MGAIRSARLNARRAEWEWRAFWLSADTAPLIYEVFANPARCERDQFADAYLVIDTRQDNIKVREDSLQVKQLIEQYDRFQAYRHKQTFRFPVATGKLLEIFPRLSRSEGMFSDIGELNAALLDHGYQPRYFEVRKERYKRRVDGIAIEWATIRVARRRFWSVAVTGPELDRVAGRAANLPNNFTVVGGYRQLLAQLDQAA